MRRAWAWLMLAGCSLPEAAWVGEHVVVHADPGRVPCGDLVGHMDAFVAALADEFDVAAPSGDDRVDFYWLDEAGFKERTICINDGACAWRGAVYSVVAPIDHELVHAVAHRFGTPPPFFIEGLAVAYGVPLQGEQYDDASVVSTPIAAAMAEREGLWVPPENYLLGGAFVSFLIERHGVAAVMQVYARLRLLDGAGRVSRVFEAELGESLAAAEAAFDELRDECPVRGFRRKLFECAAPAVAWDGRQMHLHRTLDCDQEDVVGPGLDTVAVYRTIELAEPGRYGLAMVGDVGVGSAGSWNRVLLLRCGGCGGYAEAELTEVLPTDELDLPAGRYSLQMFGPAEEATGIGVRIDWLGPAGQGKPAKPAE